MKEVLRYQVHKNGFILAENYGLDNACKKMEAFVKRDKIPGNTYELVEVSMSLKTLKQIET